MKKLSIIILIFAGAYYVLGQPLANPAKQERFGVIRGKAQVRKSG